MVWVRSVTTWTSTAEGIDAFNRGKAVPVPASHGTIRTMTDAPHVSVYDEAGLAEHVTEEHVGSFAPDPGKGHQFLHRVRDLAPIAFNDRLGGAHQRFGLLPKEAGCDDQFLHVLGLRSRHRRRIGEFAEEDRRDPIDPRIGALRGKNRRHQALPGRLEVKADARLWINGGQDFSHPTGARSKLLFGFGH